MFSGVLTAPPGLLVREARSAESPAVAALCWALAVGYIVLAAPFLSHWAAVTLGRAVGLREVADRGEDRAAAGAAPDPARDIGSGSS